MHIALALCLESCFGEVGLFSGCFLELNGDQKLSGSFSAQRERSKKSATALGEGAGLFGFPPTSYLTSGSFYYRLCSNP